MTAAEAGKVAVVRWLLHHHAHPFQRDAQGRSALERAQSSGRQKVVALLGSVPGMDPTGK